MMVMFTWHSGGSDSCFNCKRWDGRTFPSLEVVPELPVHPNCHCVIEAVVDSQSAEQLGQAGEALERIRGAAIEALNIVTGYKLSSWFGEKVLAAVRDFQEELCQFVQTLEVFWRNYQDLRKANTIGADKYFHSKASAEAAQLGKTGENIADFIGQMRELTDFWKNLLVKKMQFDAVVEDMNSDLKANAYGRRAGRENPDKPAGDLVKVYRPRGLDEKY